jgi:internalin A
LPESIGQLISLTYLSIRGNQLNALPESIGQLNSLVSLDISENELNELPNSVGQLMNLSNFIIDDNPLIEISPEIVNKDGIAVRNYYQQILEVKTDYIYEAKLLIIGGGGAGKTSIANKLINCNYKLKIESSDNPEKSTEGIDVLRFDFPHSSGNNFRINIWDFGGQEIYHATHQFFLTKRSLYLLIADTRQDNTDFNYWLEVVELLSQSSPVLIIKNATQTSSNSVATFTILVSAFTSKTIPFSKTSLFSSQNGVLMLSTRFSTPRKLIKISDILLNPI